jgi:hypothetical protein
MVPSLEVRWLRYAATASKESSAVLPGTRQVGHGNEKRIDALHRVKLVKYIPGAVQKNLHSSPIAKEVSPRADSLQAT